MARSVRLKAATKLTMRKSAQLAAWTIIAFLGASCDMAPFVSVNESPIARYVFLTLLELLALADITAFDL